MFWYCLNCYFVYKRKFKRNQLLQTFPFRQIVMYREVNAFKLFEIVYQANLQNWIRLVMNSVFWFLLNLYFMDKFELHKTVENVNNLYLHRTDCYPYLSICDSVSCSETLFIHLLEIRTNHPQGLPLNMITPIKRANGTRHNLNWNTLKQHGSDWE